MIYIFGPCAIEDEEKCIETAKYLQNLMKSRDFYFKCSWDKANRTSIKGARSFNNIDRAVNFFTRLKESCPNIKITTDFHESNQPELFSSIIDVAQIPAFLCRQTDLIVECAKHFNIVNIKKGQWLSPENVIASVDKVRSINPEAKVWITERGVSFGYYKLLIDPTIVDQLKDHYDAVILDATHSTQRSRSVFGNQADRRCAERYLLSAPVFEYDGVFAECHPDPSRAISDADSQIELYKMPELIRKFDAIYESLNE